MRRLEKSTKRIYSTLLCMLMCGFLSIANAGIRNVVRVSLADLQGDGQTVYRNHPKQADFYMTFLLVNFAVKNAMFNLNENNRFVMAQYPSDMRIGVNGMCGQVRAVGLDPTNGDVYIFVGMSRKIMKLLHWERGGFAMYYKRLEQGRFHPRIFLRQGIGFRSMRWDELVLLMEGISPKVARRHRYEIEEKTASEEENNRQNIWLSR